MRSGAEYDRTLKDNQTVYEGSLPESPARRAPPSTRRDRTPSDFKCSNLLYSELDRTTWTPAASSARTARTGGFSAITVTGISRAVFTSFESSGVRA